MTGTGLRTRGCPALARLDHVAARLDHVTVPTRDADLVMTHFPILFEGGGGGRDRDEGQDGWMDWEVGVVT